MDKKSSINLWNHIQNWY